MSVLIVFLFGLNVGGIREFILGGSSGKTTRIAVLPFTNLSNDDEQEFFSDAMTQEMINELGRLHPDGLSVIARTSVMQYKGSSTGVEKIGKELEVEYLLEGSTQREGSHVRIIAELIRVKDQATLWGDTYNREMTEILKLQSEVAQNVAKTLALKLLPDERDRLTIVRLINPEAHDFYLKGTLHWRKLTQRDIDIAEYYFNRALEIDSTHAPVFGGLAWVWAARQQMGIVTMKEAAPSSIKYALKAIALDTNSAEAHFTMAVIKSWILWDWEGARPHWKRALELNPNDALTHTYYSSYLAILGDVEKGRIHSERAVELDPYNAMIHSMHAALLNFIPAFEEAEKSARRALELQHDIPIGKSNLARALEGQGKTEEVITRLREAFADDPDILAVFEEGLRDGGYTGARHALAEMYADLYNRGDSRILRAQSVAGQYFSAGEYEMALDWFEKAVENQEGNMPYIVRPGFYDVLKSNPRYLDILRKMGLPTER